MITFLSIVISGHPDNIIIAKPYLHYLKVTVKQIRLCRGLSSGITSPSRYEDLGEGYASMSGITSPSSREGFTKLHGEYLRRTPRRNSPFAGSAFF
jgi:hypothetical protein